MSILINLLPDIRQAKLRERRRRQLVSGVSILVWVVCGGIVGLLSIYELGQKALNYGLSQDIAKNESQIKSIDGLADALTAEQHLESLSSLYSQRVYMSKFFTAYQAADPKEIALSSLGIDSSNLLTVTGTTTSYSSVSKLARALSASNVTVGANALASNTPYFSSVQVTSVSSDSKGVSFTITATMSPGVTSGQ